MKIKVATSVLRDRLSMYLDEIQNDFEPPLFVRIHEKSNVRSSKEYVDKILRFGTAIYSSDTAGNISGVLFIYHNNHVEKKAYIPLLSVKKQFAGQGIATRLLEFGIELAFLSDMNEVTVKTWKNNFSALKLYTKLGFVIIDSKDDIVLSKYKT